jgi:hypothetical protein
MTGKGKNNNKGNYNDKNKCEGHSPFSFVSFRIRVTFCEVRMLW